MDNEKSVLTSKRIKLFLIIEFVLVILVTLPLFIFNVQDSIIILIVSGVFMFVPLIATLVTRKITIDKSSLSIKPNFKKNWKKYLLSAYLPSTLIMLGAVIYFVIFPSHLDLSLSIIKDLALQTGQDVVVPTLTMSQLVIVPFVLILLAPLFFVNYILAFGEEIGWRGYLLPLLTEKFGVVKGILLNCALWGMVHAPLVCFGVNYAGNYIGSPFTGILMMIVFATSIGILLCYLTIKTKSVIPACISHGVINAVREAPLFICITSYNALIGPKPSGIIGMIGFIILGVILLIKLKRDEEKEKIV